MRPNPYAKFILAVGIPLVALLLAGVLFASNTPLYPLNGAAALASSPTPIPIIIQPPIFILPTPTPIRIIIQPPIFILPTPTPVPLLLLQPPVIKVPIIKPPTAAPAKPSGGNPPAAQPPAKVDNPPSGGSGGSGGPGGPISMGRMIEPQWITLMRGITLNLLSGGSFAMPIFPDQRVAPTIVGATVSVEFLWIGGPAADKYEIVIMAVNGTVITRTPRFEAEKFCLALLCRATVSWTPGSRKDFSWAVTTTGPGGKTYKSLPQVFSLPDRG